MTPKEFSIDIVKQLTEAGFVAYWAGGCVRDLLRNVEPNDFDVATNAAPGDVRKLFGRHRTLAVGESFGVIIVLGPKSAGQVEVATFRSEGEYLDGRRPESVEFCTPEEDAHRRDFTINGMFYDPLNETVHDFVGGQDDLKQGVLRAIGDPHDRMSEDKLRMLRAVRFAAVLDFELDETTADAVKDMASQIVVVSAERIAQELKKMLVHRNRSRAIKLCETLGLLDVILPEVADETIQDSLERWDSTLLILDRLESPSFESALAVLLRDVPARSDFQQKNDTGVSVASICRRLKLSNSEIEKTNWLVTHRDLLSKFAELSLAEKKRLVVNEHFKDLIVIEEALVDSNQRDAEMLATVQSFLQKTPSEELDPPELIDGADLIRLGNQPGPNFRAWLNAVREAQLNNEISTKEEAFELIKELSDNPES